MLRPAIFSLFLILPACAVGVAPSKEMVRHVDIDPSFTSSERATILASMRNWDAAPHAHFYEGGGDVKILKVTDPAEIAQVAASTGRNDVLGITDTNDTRIRIFPAASTELEETVTHELGHVFKVRYPGADPIHCTVGPECSHSYMIPVSNKAKTGPVEAVDVAAFELVDL